MAKILALFFVFFTAFCGTLCAGELRSFSATAGFERAKVFVPKSCVSKNSLGDMLIECKKSWAKAQVLNIEIGCYEAAKTLVDLAGDEPRGLVASGLDGEKIELRIPLKTAKLKLQITPVSQNSPLPNIIICEHGIALSIFGNDKELVENIAKNSVIEPF